MLLERIVYSHISPKSIKLQLMHSTNLVFSPELYSDRAIAQPCKEETKEVIAFHLGLSSACDAEWIYAGVRMAAANLFCTVYARYRREGSELGIRVHGTNIKAARHFCSNFLEWQGFREFLSI